MAARRLHTPERGGLWESKAPKDVKLRKGTPSQAAFTSSRSVGEKAPPGLDFWPLVLVEYPERRIPFAGHSEIPGFLNVLRVSDVQAELCYGHPTVNSNRAAAGGLNKHRPPFSHSAQ